MNCSNLLNELLKSIQVCHPDMKRTAARLKVQDARLTTGFVPLGAEIKMIIRTLIINLVEIDGRAPGGEEKWKTLSRFDKDFDWPVRNIS